MKKNQTSHNKLQGERSAISGYLPQYEEFARCVYDSIIKRDNCFYKETLSEAVAHAKKITGKGGAIILSPASASYGYFKNFEERGDVFRSLCGL